MGSCWGGQYRVSVREVSRVPPSEVSRVSCLGGQ